MTREWVAEQDVLFAEIGRLRQQLAEARAMYTGAQEDLNESVGIIVALRTERDYARAEARTLGQRVQEAEAELGLLKSRLDGAVLARSAAVTVIARVRELCDQWRDLPVEPPYMTTYQSIQEFIRHALDGTE